VAPKRVALDGTRVVSGEVRIPSFPIVPDERGVDYRSGCVTGPAAALLRLPGEVACRGSRIALHQSSERPLSAALSCVFERANDVLR
jgi:hypothetical protein